VDEMARMGGKRHVKALAAPRTWKIGRKKNVFIAKPDPGPHPLNLSLPACVIVRDVLGETVSAKEAKAIIKQGKVFVDGKQVREQNRPVGLMDVVSFPSVGKHYRATVDRDGKIKLVEATEGESNFKVGRVMAKYTCKGGELTVRLHDGSNIRVPGEIPISNGDSVVLSLPERKLVDVIRVKEGTLCFAFRGGSAGRLGRFTSGSPSGLKRRALVELRADDGSSFSTLRAYVMAVGVEEPRVTLT